MTAFAKDTLLRLRANDTPRQKEFCLLVEFHDGTKKVFVGKASDNSDQLLQGCKWTRAEWIPIVTLTEPTGGLK